jgi:hypothetical protein
LPASPKNRRWGEEARLSKTSIPASLSPLEAGRVFARSSTSPFPLRFQGAMLHHLTHWEQEPLYGAYGKR